MTPHTLAKHLLLTRYLDRWFPILGRSHPRIHYIDGFAGPGEYKRGERGSPILAIESARTHITRGTLPSNINIDFTFVEACPDYARFLQDKLDTLTIPAQFKIKLIPGEFATVVRQILDGLASEGRTAPPTFAFVDPFGFSGIPLELMDRILGNPRCEVFINFMVDFMNRFLEHPNEEVVAHFPITFGTPEVLDIPKQPGDRVRALLDLYRRQLKRHARFVGRFDMHGKRDQQTYSLFFASNASKGFHKMKEAMWSVDRGEGTRFSDFEPGGVDQTSFMPQFVLRDELLGTFRGQTVPMTDIERFVIEETDYLPQHARAVLREAESREEVRVTVLGANRRRKGEFPVDKVAIAFPSGNPTLW
jgi:three-Cys-motif partner protein